MIEFNNVNFHYQNQILFKNTNFTLPLNSRAILTGANGAGKSTLLHLIAKLIEPNSGKITSLIKVSFVGHECFLYGNLTVKENLDFFLKIKNIQTDSKLLAEKWGVKALLNNLIKHLSHGEKQKVSLALTFSEESDLLLLDEPITGLDQETKTLFFQELNNFMHKGNRSLIYCLHNHEEISHFKFNLTNSLHINSSNIEIKKW